MTDRPAHNPTDPQQNPGKVIFQRFDEDGNVVETLVHKIVDGDPEYTDYRVFGDHPRPAGAIREIRRHARPS